MDKYLQFSEPNSEKAKVQARRHMTLLLLLQCPLQLSKMPRLRFRLTGAGMSSKESGQGSNRQSFELGAQRAEVNNDLRENELSQQATAILSAQHT